MPSTDPRVDAYIANAAEFARPILTHLRRLVHESCPEVAEDIKWRMPFFSYKGPLAGMGAFKAYCAFGFWKGTLVVPGRARDAGGIGQFGRLTTIADLPPASQLKAYIRKAAALNDSGVKVERRPRPKKPLRTPPALAAALKKNARARAAFDAFSPSHKREYVEWIVDAKTEETRSKRITTAVDWIASGKSRNWKYEKR